MSNVMTQTSNEMNLWAMLGDMMPGSIGEDFSFADSEH
jgi:hypothetical protein